MADEKTVQELFSADKLKEFKDICENLKTTSSQTGTLTIKNVKTSR